MTKHTTVLAIVMTLCAVSESAAQQRDSLTARQPIGSAQARAGTPHYDVVVEVPELSVEHISLKVRGVQAQLALDALVANLVSVSAGAAVGIERVELGIHGVLAEAYLYIDLDNVAAIARRVTATIDRNPQLLTRLLETVDSAVTTVGGVANTALQPGGVVSQTVGAAGRTLNNLTQPGGVLSQTVNTLGQTVQTTLGTTGSIVERTLDTAGKVVNERTLGNLTSMTVVNQVTNSAGQVVKTVRDTTGRLIEYTVDAAGKVTGARLR